MLESIHYPTPPCVLSGQKQSQRKPCPLKESEQRQRVDSPDCSVMASLCQRPLFSLTPKTRRS